MTITPTPGALVFCHTRGVIGKAIRLGEWLRFRSGDQWNHVAIVSHQMPDGDWMVLEAEGHGVVAGYLSTIAPGGNYEIVTLPADVDPARVLKAARSQVGQHYGWITVVSLALQIIVPDWLHLPSFRSKKTWICSALAGECLRVGGWWHDWPDVYQVVPSELYAALTSTA